MSTQNLQRFTDAQLKTYTRALTEISQGRKQSHWMWYIFPQVQGLGFSEMSRLYAIKDLNEAQAFLQHPILGKRLIGICEELLQLKENNPTKIFGSPDDMKLQSCMTLFSVVPGAHMVFQLVLDKFFGGQKDEKTLRILNET